MQSQVYFGVTSQGWQVTVLANLTNQSTCLKVEVISYSSVCEVVNSYLETTKVSDDLKAEMLSISCAAQSIVEEEDAEEIKGILNTVSVFYQISPEYRAEEQHKYHIPGLVCPYVTGG